MNASSAGACPVVWLLAVSLLACTRPPSYQLQGQIVAIDPGRQELTIKHDDIRGFMPGMTMPFKVRDASTMAGKASATSSPRRS